MGCLMVKRPSTLPHAPEASLLHRGLGHVEFFDYPLEAMDGLKLEYAELKKDGYKGLSFHAPMPRPAFFPFAGVSCFFLNENPEHRALSFSLVEETLQHAQSWQADYVVTHLTFGKTDTRNPVTARDLANRACAKLAALSDQYAIPIHLEFAAYTRAFNLPEQFVGVVSQYDELGICLDTGHTMLGARLHGRDYLDDIRALAPQTKSLHLWNTRGENQAHIPLHPSQLPSEGWIDIEQTLKIVITCNPRIAIVFEYPVKRLTSEVQAGYDWVETMALGITGKN